mmetsp:Transcript_6936/g.17710  ORF Transcript_6936/g.17710 Transcript_6936/m.17710 type:complete len:220 (-) Transcript_6936:6388-7047(-)
MIAHAASRPRTETPTPFARDTISEAEPGDKVTSTLLSFTSETSCHKVDAASSFPVADPDPSNLTRGPKPPSRTIAYRRVTLASAMWRKPVAACSHSVALAPVSSTFTSRATTTVDSIATPASIADISASATVNSEIFTEDKCGLARRCVSTGPIPFPSNVHSSARHPASTSAALVWTDNARIAPLACSRTSSEHWVSSCTMKGNPRSLFASTLLANKYA